MNVAKASEKQDTHYTYRICLAPS